MGVKEREIENKNEIEAFKRSGLSSKTYAQGNKTDGNILMFDLFL